MYIYWSTYIKLQLFRLILFTKFEKSTNRGIECNILVVNLGRQKGTKVENFSVN